MLIAGVDESGTGSLAGPVFAAAVVLPEDCRIVGLRDSKLLSVGHCAKLADLIQRLAVTSAVGSASVHDVNELNVRGASLLAMRRAVAALDPQPTDCLVDGGYIPDPPLSVANVRAVPHGDATEPVIIAAGILARAARNAEMIRLDSAYPGYGFAQHKGYLTASARAALQQLGPSPLHHSR